eukprot:CAMPEP_0113625866 /NCGR_PEP_ID=MMETSP0017_2-20120614/13365_1 /TAXON_ID=2856 /ORGANISM="Cylindrotheca closterium" /LENGTH=383 /DNA_ID=CAMNT_0000536003 /DNA_START=60 /DNA_END=1211 /DNA_ORIENTATION=- /assembly_acc=CAM_ASM_000147
MAETTFVPSNLQVDFDKNITKLYESITSSTWDVAIACAQQRPAEAKTWVVRHYEDQGDAAKEVMWRFLPIHSACARQPPAAVILALINAYPDGVKCIDDQGMYPLHYACGNQASRDVIRQLLMTYPQAAKKRDPRGMLPIHYLTCWGPSSISVVDMVLVANREVANAQDVDGNTPMDLAKEGEYPEREAVIAALNRWVTGEADLGLMSLNKLPTPEPASKQPSTLDLIEDKMATSRGLTMTSVGLDEALPKTTEEKDVEIIRLRQQLAQANDERDGLRQTLAELAEGHDRMKMKSVILGDRLGSLNASLYGMMEQQNTVLNSLRKREDRWNTVAQLRREKMKELLQLEEQDESEQLNLKDSLLKQTKEMEAIQAVIAAVRAGQ